MNDVDPSEYPGTYDSILNDTTAAGFTMPSDPLTCSLLRTLAASKPNSKFLELGTGTGLSTAWILDGMCNASHLLSIDSDATLLSIAQKHLGADNRLQLIDTNGEEWLEANQSQRFDYIFADTWPGKYNHLEMVLSMVKAGGFYIVDDMLPQPNWPEGHDLKATALVDYLKSRNDFAITIQSWASGVIVATKRA